MESWVKNFHLSFSFSLSLSLVDPSSNTMRSCFHHPNLSQSCRRWKLLWPCWPWSRELPLLHRIMTTVKMSIVSARYCDLGQTHLSSFVDPFSPFSETGGDRINTQLKRIIHLQHNEQSMSHKEENNCLGFQTHSQYWERERKKLAWW